MKKLLKLIGVIALTTIVGFTMAFDNGSTKDKCPAAVYPQIYQRANGYYIGVYTQEVFKQELAAKNAETPNIEKGDRYVLSIRSNRRRLSSEGIALRFLRTSARAKEFDF